MKGAQAPHSWDSKKETQPSCEPTIEMKLTISPG
jgi:hypothetical protein